MFMCAWLPGEILQRITPQHESGRHLCRFESCSTHTVMTATKEQQEMVALAAPSFHQEVRK